MMERRGSLALLLLPFNQTYYPQILLLLIPSNRDSGMSSWPNDVLVAFVQMSAASAFDFFSSLPYQILQLNTWS